MTKEELMTLFLNPDQAGLAVDELRGLVEEYPYFHTGHQLYLRALRQTDEKQMASQLKITAFFVRDRDVLYHYINHPSPQINIHHIQSDPAQPEILKQTSSEVTTCDVGTTENDDEITPVKIREVYSEKQLLDDLIKSAPKRTDLCAESPPKQNPAPEETKLYVAKDDENRVWSPSELIDYFLRTNPKIVPNDKKYEVDFSETQQDNQEVVTELLADIYATQGYKDKAIKIYEQLILKNPEKHIYFAAQIERLKE